MGKNSDHACLCHHHLDLAELVKDLRKLRDSIRMAAAKFVNMASVYARPRLATAWKYGKAELMPPSPAEIPTAIGQAAKMVQSAMTFKWANLTLREAWLNTLVGVEVGCWFFIGECIGKGSLVAYKVNPINSPH